MPPHPARFTVTNITSNMLGPLQCSILEPRYSLSTVRPQKAAKSPNPHEGESNTSQSSPGRRPALASFHNVPEPFAPRLQREGGYLHHAVSLVALNSSTD